LKIKIVSINNPHDQWVYDEIQKFIKKIGRDYKIDLIEIKPDKKAPNLIQKKKSEAQSLDKYIRNTFLICLDERGDSFDSINFSKKLLHLFARYSDITFLIGGADGLDNQVLAQSNLTLSLSKMTLPHQLAKIVLIEQFYRAISISKNHPYHRE
jgi:23S rRNA (pseudouridine1915-N3)-methyltransferase